MQGRISRFSEGRTMLLRCERLEPPMSQMGHPRRIDLLPAVATCPLRAESGQVGRHLAKSALCRNRTHALQQKAYLRSNHGKRKGCAKDTTRWAVEVVPLFRAQKRASVWDRALLSVIEWRNPCSPHLRAPHRWRQGHDARRPTTAA
jgi:hypothetical protein